MTISQVSSNDVKVKCVDFLRHDSSYLTVSLGGFDGTPWIYIKFLNFIFLFFYCYCYIFRQQKLTHTYLCIYI